MPIIHIIMCGRYTITKSIEEICNTFAVEPNNELFSPTYNIAPNQKSPIITNQNQNQLSFMHWGLVPFWAKNKKISNKLINSRVETISEKPSFKYAIDKRRCLVISDGYYEWKNNDKGKIPYRITTKDEKLFLMAGIWELWAPGNNPYYSFSILTKQANEQISNIHHRMPAIITNEQRNTWLNEIDTYKAISMIKESSNIEMKYYEVSKAVNTPNNNYKELVIPIS